MSEPSGRENLRATLELSAESPLAEVSAESLDELFDRINQKLVEGVPESVTDEELLQLVRTYRALALKWDTEEAQRKPRAKRQPHGNAVDIDLDL